MTDHPTPDLSALWAQLFPDLARTDSAPTLEELAGTALRVDYAQAGSYE